MAQNYKTVTFRMSEEDHRNLKLLSALTGKSLKDLLQAGVDTVKKDYAKELKQAKGLQNVQ